MKISQETNLTMKELPDHLRPYEKCLAFGEAALTDAELISTIIRTGTKGEKSTALAERILSIDKNGLLNLIRMNVDQLCSIKGIGKVKAIQLKCVGEMAKRISRQNRPDRISFATPSEIADYYMEEVRHESQERLYVLAFDMKNHLRGERMISRGSSNQTLADPKEIFSAAIHMQADHIVLLHNHPSGDPEPSNYDKIVTRQIYQGGILLGIPLTDHIIIGDRTFFSFFNEELLPEEEK